MPPKRYIVESSDESGSEYQDEPLFVPRPDGTTSAQSQAAKKRQQIFFSRTTGTGASVPQAMLASRASESRAAAPPVARGDRAVNGVGNGNEAGHNNSTNNNNVGVSGDARSGAGRGGNGGGDRAPRAQPAIMVETYDDVKAQIERHVKNATQLMIDASTAVTIKIGVGESTKTFIVFDKVLTLHSRFFRNFFTDRRNNIAVGPPNSNLAPTANNAQASRREEKRAVQSSASVPAPVQGSLDEAMILTRVRQVPNRSSQGSSNSNLNFPPPTRTMKPEPIEIFTPSPDLIPAHPLSGPTIVVNIPTQLTLLQTITPAQFTCFLSWLYTGNITKESISDCNNHLASSKPTLESLWFLGLKLQCPSFQNRVMEALLATKKMHDGDWPSPSRVKFIEDKLSSLPPINTPEQNVLRNLAVTCVAINTPFQKCNDGSEAAKAWDKLLDEKSAVVKEALKLKTEKWTNRKPWHKNYLKFWLVPEAAGERTV